MDKLAKVRAEVEKLKKQLLRGACSSQVAMETRCKEEAYNEVLAILDTMQEEPVSEDFESALAKEWQGYIDRGAATVDALEDNTQELAFAKGFYRGAQWQKQQDQSTIELAEDHAMLAGMEKMKEEMMKNIWKPADGDDLPEIDREVIALLDNGKVVFAHRPPEYWDGNNIITGKVTRNYPKTYDKGGWNIPDIVYWLDVELPKLED